MITDKDIIKLKSVFATKEDLERLEIRTGESFIEVNNKIDNLENQFKDLKNEVLNMEDHIIRELKSMQLDQQVSLSHRREIADHETRITNIESKLLLT